MLALSDSGLNHLSFGVEDIHGEYERLKAAGVEFLGEVGWIKVLKLDEYAPRRPDELQAVLFAHAEAP